MRRVWIALVALAGGCRGILGIESPIDLPADAGEPPAPPDTAPPSCRAWHPRALDPCTLGVPLPAIELTAGAYTYDTTTAGGKLFDDHGRTVVESPLAIEQAGGAAVAVLSIDALAIDAGATLRVIGTKPLVIAAWSTIAIDGVVDASSHLGVTDEAAHIAQNIQVGAGANAACTGTTGQHGADARGVGSGGGGGGALQGLGGDAPASGAPEVAGGAGGAAIALPAILVGGCGGGSSGAAGTTATLPATKSSVAQGGAGGGAIRLVAQTQLRVAGAIHANGAGGAGGPTASSCGGGGGGAGGDVELEAATIAIDGAVTATGGGGGGGAGGSSRVPGHDGSDGAIGVDAAPGGTIADDHCGAPGGAGSSRAMLAGAAAPPAACTAGGGGGGGGAGFVIIAAGALAVNQTATISPPASIRPPP